MPLENLNSKQKQAVKHVHTPVLVLAGAGSGKTRVITEKIAYLICECGIKAHHIAAVTFTNKAAREMTSRIKELLPGPATRGLTVSTFHTLGLKIIRSEASTLELHSGFTIYDADDSRSLLKNLYQQQFSDNELCTELADDTQYYISKWKNECLLPDQVSSYLSHQTSSDDYYHENINLFIDYYHQYTRHLRTYNAVDFDDLILLPLKLFEQHPDIRSKWQAKIQYLLVDEYQDTNTAQYDLVKILVAEKDGLTVVGDDDQSIYCWRGARPENLAMLEKDFHNIQIIKLEQNYRSSGRILKAANHLIKNNPHVFEKSLWSDMGYGDPIKIIRAADEHKEVQHVVSSLVSNHFRLKKSYADFAILYRGNHQSRLFEKQLREQQIPYKLTGGTSFFAYTEIKDMMAYLKLLVNPDDNTAFLRIINTPRRQIGTSTIEKLNQFSKQVNKPLFSCCSSLALSEFMGEKSAGKLNEFAQWIESIQKMSTQEHPVTAVKQMIADMDYFPWLMETSKTDAQATRRNENVEELVEWLQRLYEHEGEHKELEELVNKMILLDILERNEEEEEMDCVTLMTLHSAKGLEFPHVYMVGMEEELLPHRTSIEEDNIEEERRLCYVGITRARQQLTLTLASKRRQFGEIVDCEPSRFISELPQDDLEWIQGKEQLQGEEKKAHAKASLANIRALLDD